MKILPEDVPNLAEDPVVSGSGEKFSALDTTLIGPIEFYFMVFGPNDLLMYVSPKQTWHLVCGPTNTKFTTPGSTPAPLANWGVTDYFLLKMPDKNYEINNFQASNPLCPLESVAVTSLAAGNAADFTYNSVPVAKTGWTALGSKINLEFPLLKIYERYFTFRVRGTAKGHINAASQAIAHKAFTSDIKVRMINCNHAQLTNPVLGDS